MVKVKGIKVVLDHTSFTYSVYTVLDMFNKRLLSFLTVVTLVTLGIYFSNLFHSHKMEQFRDGRQRIINITRTGKILEDLQRNSFLDLRPFHISGHDVMVFLHMQKTGGTSFGKNLVQNLVLKQQCKKIVKQLIKPRFECKRPNSSEIWLYSRYSTGWLCGLHADWTTLTSCIPRVLKSHLGNQDLNKTRLFYVSFLRDPVDRFLSEFKHVQRGATWKASTYICNGTKYKLPFCYKGVDWHDVKLSVFLNCPHNLASNRQTRMMADLYKVGCHNHITSSSRARAQEKIMLESAKNNLRNLSFFGLVEYQKESQYLFEKTFRLKFKRNFRQITVSDTWSSEARKEISPKQLLQIRKVNRLDRQLYSYARTLFFRRLKYFEGTYG